jgi:putative nucleotidyltransferase with HDIG domain
MVLMECSCSYTMVKVYKPRTQISYQSTYADVLRMCPDIDIPIAAVVLLAQLKAYHQGTYDHCLRVSLLARQIGTVYGIQPVNDIAIGAILHDIGKIKVPLRILDKPARLNRWEWKYINSHPEYGSQIVSNFPELQEFAPMIHAHHERPDGKGYPYRLRLIDIPISARIIAVADAVDAMRMDRPQRPRRTDAFIINELETGAGSEWDEDIVRCTLQLITHQDNLMAA